jgi:hypothetical protein
VADFKTGACFAALYARMQLTDATGGGDFHNRTAGKVKEG